MSWAGRLVMISVICGGMHTVIEARAGAVTISFNESPNEGPTTPTVDLAGCPGCILVAATPGTETATASFTAPAGFFAGLPIGLTSSRAILVEPAGQQGEPAGATSDSVLLEINNTPQIISILANFSSDPEGVVAFPPGGFPTVAETGGVQNLSGNFATETTSGMFMPNPLPAGLVIQVQSDVVPEPSSGFMIVLGLLGLKFIITRRTNRAGIPFGG